MDDIRPQVSGEPGKFVDRLRLTIRRRGLSYATEKTYVHWALRFIQFHRMLHPEKVGSLHVEKFLGDLAERRRCAVATQRLALNALVFLYSKHLGVELGELSFRYARRQRRMPTVFTHAEAMAVIHHLSGTCRTIGALMYGSGLRVNEVLRLRVKDLDLRQQANHRARRQGWKRTFHFVTPNSHQHIEQADRQYREVTCV